MRSAEPLRDRRSVVRSSSRGTRHRHAASREKHSAEVSQRDQRLARDPHEHLEHQLEDGGNSVQSVPIDRKSSHSFHSPPKSGINSDDNYSKRLFFTEGLMGSSTEMDVTEKKMLHFSNDSKQMNNKSKRKLAKQGELKQLVDRSRRDDGAIMQRKKNARKVKKREMRKLKTEERRERRKQRRLERKRLSSEAERIDADGRVVGNSGRADTPGQELSDDPRTIARKERRKQRIIERRKKRKERRERRKMQRKGGRSLDGDGMEQESKSLCK